MSTQVPLPAQLTQVQSLVWQVCPDSGCAGMTRAEFVENLVERIRAGDCDTVQDLIRDVTRMGRVRAAV